MRISSSLLISAARSLAGAASEVEADTDVAAVSAAPTEVEVDNGLEEPTDVEVDGAFMSAVEVAALIVVAVGATVVVPVAASTPGNKRSAGTATGALEALPLTAGPPEVITSGAANTGNEHLVMNRDTAKHRDKEKLRGSGDIKRFSRLLDTEFTRHPTLKFS
jgi:hypothetical protein